MKHGASAILLSHIYLTASLHTDLDSDTAVEHNINLDKLALFIAVAK